MRVDRIEGGQRERCILIGMVTDNDLLAKVAPKWGTYGLMSSPWSNLLGGWCVSYYLRHGKAPNRDILSLYENWAETSQDKATTEILSRFLRDLSEEYDTEGGRNTSYVLDQADIHFNAVAIQKLNEFLIGDLAVGDIPKAKQRIESFGAVDIGGDAGIDVFQDYDALALAFKKKAEPIVEYPGDLGRLINPAMVREGFVAFHGANKSGKSFWLQDLVWRAVMQRRRVLYFQTGDMSQGDVLMRFGTRACGVPSTSRDGRWPCRVKIPTAIRHPKGAPISEVDFEEQEFDHPLQYEEAVEAFRQVQRRRVKSANSYLRMFCHANSTISVKGIESIVEAEARKGMVADVIVIDYADILAPITRSLPPIEQINETWRALRALSQKKHVLLATASQANAKSFTARTLTRSNFSGSNLKFAEVTAAFGINQYEEERELQIQRINVLNARSFAYDESVCVNVAGCLAFSQPCMFSTF